MPIRAALLPDDLQLGIHMVEHECAADQLHSLYEVLLHLKLQCWHQDVRQEVLAGCIWVADVYSRLHSDTGSPSPNYAVPCVLCVDGQWAALLIGIHEWGV